jgi:hypothetical protein
VQPLVPSIESAGGASSLPKILAGGMIATQLLFLCITILLHSQGFKTDQTLAEVFLVNSILVSLTATSAGYFISSRAAKSGSRAPSNNGIRSILLVMIVRLALLEGANLLNVIFYLLTGDYRFLLLFILVLGLSLLAIQTPRVQEDGNKGGSSVGGNYLSNG